MARANHAFLDTRLDQVAPLHAGYDHFVQRAQKLFVASIADHEAFVRVVNCNALIKGLKRIDEQCIGDIGAFRVGGHKGNAIPALFRSVFSLGRQCFNCNRRKGAPSARISIKYMIYIDKYSFR